MKNTTKNTQKNYRKVTENPCSMCMPMGGILPFKGVAGAMVLLHGSQGCATYMRRHMAEHFNEPVDVASSSLNEKGTVYGGEQNLKRGLDNLIKLYNPGLIGVLTTCLAETIGEDTGRVASEYLKERGISGFPIISVPTPGYGDTHSEGYWAAAKAIIAKLARRTDKHSGINIIVPHISPADIREIKRILQLMAIEFTLFPDFSDTLDRPYSNTYKKIPDGGTKPADIGAMPGARATVQMGITVNDSVSPGKYLEDEFGIPLYNIPIPMGLENTDTFVQTLKEITGKKTPESLYFERGRLLDCMIDSHKYNFQGRSAVFGEPELVYAMARTCAENGVFPVVAATGSRNSGMVTLLRTEAAGWQAEIKRPGKAAGTIEPRIFSGADFIQIREACRETNVNIAIGSSDGRYLTEKEGIPLVRMGFPIHDRVGGQRLLSVGYVGTAMFLDRVTNTLLENKYRNYRSDMYTRFYNRPLTRR